MKEAPRKFLPLKAAPEPGDRLVAVPCYVLPANMAERGLFTRLTIKEVTAVVDASRGTAEIIGGCVEPCEIPEIPDDIKILPARLRPSEAEDAALAAVSAASPRRMEARAPSFGAFLQAQQRGLSGAAPLYNTRPPAHRRLYRREQRSRVVDRIPYLVYSFGSVITKAAPPRPLSPSSSFPPWRSAILREIERPRPYPPFFFSLPRARCPSPRRKRSKIISLSISCTPGPSSSTVILHEFPASSTETFICPVSPPLCSVYLCAFSHEVQQRAAQVAVDAPDRRPIRRGDFDADLFFMRQSLYFVAHVGDQLLEVHSAERRQLGHCVRV